VKESRIDIPASTGKKRNKRERERERERERKRKGSQITVDDQNTFNTFFTFNDGLLSSISKKSVRTRLPKDG